MSIRYPGGTVPLSPAQPAKKTSRQPKKPAKPTSMALEDRINAVLKVHCPGWCCGECRLSDVADHPRRHHTTTTAGMNAVIVWREDRPGVWTLGAIVDVEQWSDGWIVARMEEICKEAK